MFLASGRGFSRVLKVPLTCPLGRGGVAHGLLFWRAPWEGNVKRVSGCRAKSALRGYLKGALKGCFEVSGDSPP